MEFYAELLQKNSSVYQNEMTGFMINLLINHLKGMKSSEETLPIAQIKKKYQWIKETMKNPFLSKEIKDGILTIFERTQKTYMTLSRFCRKPTVRIPQTVSSKSGSSTSSDKILPPHTPSLTWWGDFTRGLSNILNNYWIGQVREKRRLPANRIVPHTRSHAVTTDLLFNQLNPEDRLTFMITETTNQKQASYLFSIPEILRIILTSITKTSHLFENPLHPKNPYTNVPITNETLYILFHKLYKINYNIPEVLVKYFRCNFDLNAFKFQCELEIRELAITRYANESANELNEEVVELIKTMFRNKHTRIHIDEEFPKAELVEIMRPYLYLYILQNEYFWDTVKCRRAKLILKQLIHLFITYNPSFGRRCIRLSNKGKNTKREVFHEKKHIKLSINDVDKILVNPERLKKLTMSVTKPTIIGEHDAGEVHRIRSQLARVRSRSDNEGLFRGNPSNYEDESEEESEEEDSGAMEIVYDSDDQDVVEEPTRIIIGSMHFEYIGLRSLNTEV